MKKATLLPILLISSTLTFSACTPKDKAVTDNGTRAKILSQNDKKGGGKNGAGGEFRIGGYSALAVLLDRQIEVLEVIRLAIAQERAEKTQYTVGKAQTSDVSSPGIKNYSIDLTANKAVLNYATDSGEYDTVLTKKWKVDVTSKDDKITLVKAVADKSVTKVDKKKTDKKTYFNLTEEKIEITVTKIESQAIADLYELSVNSEGKFNASLEDVKNKGSVTSNLKFRIDGRDLVMDKIKTSIVEGSITVAPDKGNESTVTIQDANLVVTAEGLCNSINGRVKFKSGGKDKYMNLDDKKIVVENSKYQIALAECSRRPTVDISRFFVW